MNINDYYLMVENEFFYFQVESVYTIRNKGISDLLGDDHHKDEFIGKEDSITSDIRYARFRKKNQPFSVSYMLNNDIKMKKLDLKSFLNLKFEDIPKGEDDFISLRNKRLIEKEHSLKIKRDKIRTNYKAISSFKPVPKREYHLWHSCRKCGLKPIIWEYDNGCFTACNCGKNEYDHVSVRSESIMSHLKRNDGSVLDYDSDGLLKEWNHYVETGEMRFKVDFENDIW